MIGYIVRRLLLAVFTIWTITVLAFVIIQLPEGRHGHQEVGQPDAAGGSSRSRYGGQPQGVLWPESANAHPLLQVDVEHAARGLGHILSVLLRRPSGEAGQGVDRREDPDDDRAHGLHYPRHVDLRHSRRDILGGPPAFDRGLLLHLHRVQRPRRAGLPAGPRAHVHGLRLLQPERRRP